MPERRILSVDEGPLETSPRRWRRGGARGSRQPPEMLQSPHAEARNRPARVHLRLSCPARRGVISRPEFPSSASIGPKSNRMIPPAGVAELVDARDLKSRGPKGPCRFDSGLRHQSGITRKTED